MRVPAGRRSTRSTSSGPMIRTSSPVSSRDLADRRLLDASHRDPACPWAASRCVRRARDGGCRRPATVGRLHAERRPRRPRSRSRSSAVPRRRGGARAPDHAGSLGPSPVIATRGRGGPSVGRTLVAGWIERQRPRRLTSGATSSRRRTVARSAEDRNDPVGWSPSRRSLVRADGRTKCAAGRAAYLAAMLCCMGRYGTGSVGPCKGGAQLHGLLR